MSNEMTYTKIEKMIYHLRGQKVMLDSDLAELYGVETKRLNEQVRRNIERFPEDFMFECTFEELDVLRSQIATANAPTIWNYKRRVMPMVFTENGVAMLSSVLNSSQAIQVNIAIMRIFTRLKSFLLLEKDLGQRMDNLERGTHKMFKNVFERLDEYEELVTPKLPGNRKKIGLQK